MNIYLYELKSLRKNTLIWTISIIALAALYFAIYPGMVKDADNFKQLLSGYPPQVRAALGISLDNITSLLGFYSMIFTFITLCGAIQASNLGISILSKETRERTADFLLVKPISRTTIVSAKLAAAFSMLTLTWLIYTAVAFAFANMVGSDFSGKLFFLITLTMFFVQVIFFALGVFLSVIISKIKSVLTISLGFVFGLFIVGAILATEKDDIARYFSPFKYFDFTYILKNSGYEISYLITGAIIVVSAVTATYFIYIRKDIHSVS